YKNTGRSLQTSFFLISLAFILILYSTFLTRSGILGETSVHSFADLGMNAQLFLFLYVFIWLPTILSFKTLKGKLIGYLFAIGLILLSYFQIPVLILDLFNVSAGRLREIAEIIGRSF